MEADNNSGASFTPVISPEPQHSGRRHALVALGMAVLVGAVAFGVYFWRDQSARQELVSKAAKVAELEEQNSNLKKDVAAKEAEIKDIKEGDTLVSAGSSAETVTKSLQAMVNKKDFTSLPDYTATKVNVIIAASEGLGERTSAQLVEDLKYLSSATAPWNFSLPAAELSEYRTGDYALYFPAGALIGKSADGKVMSFTFDAAGKVAGIFMAANADLL